MWFLLSINNKEDFKKIVDTFKKDDTWYIEVGTSGGRIWNQWQSWLCRAGWSEWFCGNLDGAYFTSSSVARGSKGVRMEEGVREDLGEIDSKETVNSGIWGLDVKTFSKDMFRVWCGFCETRISLLSCAVLFKCIYILSGVYFAVHM